MPALSQSEIVSRAASLPDWKIDDGQLVRTFTFNNFVAALDFVKKIGQSAERAGHHPDIDIRYNKVRLALVTHDAGGLTAKDFDLATAINSLV